MYLANVITLISRAHISRFSFHVVHFIISRYIHFPLTTIYSNRERKVKSFLFLIFAYVFTFKHFYILYVI